MKNQTKIMEVERLEKEIDLIKERNKKVEADKAWETSSFRIIFITAAIYIITAIVFALISVENFFLNALIPAVGYYFSTQSLPFVKRFWIDRVYKKRTQ